VWKLNFFLGLNTLPNYLGKKMNLLAVLRALPPCGDLSKNFWVIENLIEDIYNGVPKDEDFPFTQQAAVLASFLTWFPAGYLQWKPKIPRNPDETEEDDYTPKYGSIIGNTDSAAPLKIHKMWQEHDRMINQLLNRLSWKGVFDPAPFKVNSGSGGGPISIMQQKNALGQFDEKDNIDDSEDDGPPPLIYSDEDSDEGLPPLVYYDEDSSDEGPPPLVYSDSCEICDGPHGWILHRCEMYNGDMARMINGIPTKNC
jgi:hypothetical protein